MGLSVVDFAANDRRYAACFADIPRDSWSDDMLPVDRYLELGDAEVGEKVPYVLTIDGDDILHRLVVDDQLIRVARRSGEWWRALQEQGGINNSHAQALLARERETWEQEKAQEIEALREQLQSEYAQAAPAIVTSAPAAPVPGVTPSRVAESATAEAAVAEPEPVVVETAPPPSDEPYIETPRCTTCDECTDLNDRMFAYDENKQAYIADLSAGTFHDLVKAAEECQVCIIHPGKPKNLDEPGLDELVKRAELFN